MLVYQRVHQMTIKSHPDEFNHHVIPNTDPTTLNLHGRAYVHYE